MKKCFKCGQEQELNEFYKHPMMADGHLNKCKTCTKLDVRGNHSAKLDYYRQYDRQRNKLPHRIAAHDAYRQTDAGKKTARRRALKFIQNNPEKRKAHIIVGNALRNGRLNRKPCEVCGATRVHGHHHDYSKPLDVRWLCPIHHKEYHHAPIHQ